MNADAYAALAVAIVAVSTMSVALLLRSRRGRRADRPAEETYLGGPGWVHVDTLAIGGHDCEILRRGSGYAISSLGAMVALNRDSRPLCRSVLAAVRSGRLSDTPPGEAVPEESERFAWWLTGECREA